MRKAERFGLTGDLWSSGSPTSVSGVYGENAEIFFILIFTSCEDAMQRAVNTDPDAVSASTGKLVFK